MKLVRCPSCRTVNDPSRGARCAGCDHRLEGMPVRERPMPSVLRDAAQDGRGGAIVLAVLGLFSIISMTAMVKGLKKEDYGQALLFTVISLVLVGSLLWIPLKRRIHASRRDALGKATLYFLGAVAVAFGSALLLFLTCLSFDAAL